MKAFQDTLDKAFKDYFSKYRGQQYHLWLLATHPDYRRRGAGSMLSGWGMDKAAEQGWVVTVLASPMGKKLYESLGYKALGNVIVQVDGEEEKLTVCCLEYHAPKQASSNGWASWLSWVSWWRWS